MNLLRREAVLLMFSFSVLSQVFTGMILTRPGTCPNHTQVSNENEINCPIINTTEICIGDWNCENGYKCCFHNCYKTCKPVTV
ncbi:hypothetical protein CHS0354_036354 [Potamilus streckersoni]|uniref:WAP domain-containing protein n=1 Tax=Potamilus streckersoni TaxID=2493646 RepID=A0AAE0W0A5_9BIVA|nr:hypothetical protein CHS0354_036354 [Potamilus streckersoni]